MNSLPGRSGAVMFNWYWYWYWYWYCSSAFWTVQPPAERGAFENSRWRRAMTAIMTMMMMGGHLQWETMDYGWPLHRSTLLQSHSHSPAATYQLELCCVPASAACLPGAILCQVLPIYFSYV